VAGRGKAVGAVVKYGPLVYAAAQRYGPQVMEQVRAQRAPAERYVQDKVAKGNQRKKAMEHAGTVVEGSVLQIFHHNRAHWIVFSGEEPIAVHPPTGAPYDVLLKHADLSTRVKPGSGRRFPKVPRRSSPGRPGSRPSSSRASTGQRPAPSTVRYHPTPQPPDAADDEDHPTA
jgi:hypothetical protein